jgi:hypothetical protein
LAFVVWAVADAWHKDAARRLLYRILRMALSKSHIFSFKTRRS